MENSRTLRPKITSAMLRKDIETFDTTGFLDRYTLPDPAFRAMLKEFYGTFFIVPVQQMLLASRLPIPPVRSSSHSMIFITAGEANMNIGFQHHRIVPHQCFIVPAGQVFSYDRYDDNQGFLIHFGSDFIVEGLRIGGLLQSFDFLNVWGSPVIEFDPVRSVSIVAILQRMLQCFSVDGLLHSELLQSYLLVLLKELAIADAHRFSSSVQKSRNLSNRFQELLSQNYRQLHQVIQYADLLAVSPNHLNKAVREATAKSPSKWIDEAIVMEAKILLTNSDLPIGEIAMQVGVHDNSYFSRLFKRLIGVTPLEFRKRIDSSHNSRQPS